MQFQSQSESTHQPSIPQESNSKDPMPPSTAAAAAKLATRLPMTTIVATTPSLGIGLKGNLPWPALKAEMNYFARVTKRVVPITAGSSTTGTGTGTGTDGTGGGNNPRLNAVIMGRATYESIPRKFRPLKGRINIVLTRSQPGSKVRQGIEGEVSGSSGGSGGGDAAAAPEGPFVVNGLNEAIDLLRGDPLASSLGRVFVIGGAQVYRQALEMGECERVLRTKVQREYTCDVSFPVALEGEDSVWQRSEHSELCDWVGEDVPAGLQSQDDVQWEYEMWNRRSE